MILNVNEARFVENPDASVVRDAITSLKTDEFAVLSSADHFYIQTYRDDAGHFELEYREGSPTEHYAVAACDLAADDVARAFLAYLSGSATWNAQWQWERLDFEDHERESFE